MKLVIRNIIFGLLLLQIVNLCVHAEDEPSAEGASNAVTIPQSSQEGNSPAELPIPTRPPKLISQTFPPTIHHEGAPAVPPAADPEPPKKPEGTTAETVVATTPGGSTDCAFFASTILIFCSDGHFALYHLLLKTSFEVFHIDFTPAYVKFHINRRSWPESITSPLQDSGPN
ncbi:hypothetical protein FQA39_LY04685 [Lamprigera yunnana]|nr:hypothetical protein FQA39_LY04685 [Lamprigera yunnana]